MESLTSVNLHRFGDGILVEVVESDPDGDVSVRSFEFETDGPGGRILRPRSTLQSAETAMIEHHVADAGYALAESAGRSDTPQEVLSQ